MSLTANELIDKECEAYAKSVDKSELLMSKMADYVRARDAFVAAAAINQKLVKQLVAHPQPARFAYEEGRKTLAAKAHT
mgnify:CR=1 FL=1